MLRINDKFAALQAENRKGLVTFITAGDPNIATSQQILNGLPEAGADFIELGMPFSDPMADGPAIQLANQRALAAGASLKKTLAMVHKFRQQDNTTPIILMGYYNPIYQYGVEPFITDASTAGVDGLIVVDLPAEEDAELCQPARLGGLDWIRLTTPTSDEARLQVILKNTSGFVYYVSIAGITGTSSASQASIQAAVERIKSQSDLPVAVGFGIKTAQDVRSVAEVADAVVVGSAIVEKIRQAHDDKASDESLIEKVHHFVRELASGLT